MRWPKTLYLTPPEWGEESHVLVEEEVQDVVRDLQNLGVGSSTLSFPEGPPWPL